MTPPSEEGGGLAEQSDGKTEGEITTDHLMHKRRAEDEGRVPEDNSPSSDTACR